CLTPGGVLGWACRGLAWLPNGPNLISPSTDFGRQADSAARSKPVIERGAEQWRRDHGEERAAKVADMRAEIQVGEPVQLEDHVEQSRAEESLPTRILGCRGSSSCRPPHIVCSSARRGHEETAAASASPGWRERQSWRGRDLNLPCYLPLSSSRSCRRRSRGAGRRGRCGARTPRSCG